MGRAGTPAASACRRRRRGLVVAEGTLAETDGGGVYGREEERGWDAVAVGVGGGARAGQREEAAAADGVVVHGDGEGEGSQGLALGFLEGAGLGY